MDKQIDSFQFKCYDALHAIAKAATVKEIARQLNSQHLENDVRRELNLLCKQRALSKKKIAGVWHYFI